MFFIMVITTTQVGSPFDASLYSQHRLISLRLIEHSRKNYRFSSNRTITLKVIGDLFAYYQRNNIISPLARIITLGFNWLE